MYVFVSLTTLPAHYFARAGYLEAPSGSFIGFHLGHL